MQEGGGSQPGGTWKPDTGAQVSTGVTASLRAVVRVSEVHVPFHKDPISAAIN